MTDTTARTSATTPPTTPPAAPPSGTVPPTNGRATGTRASQFRTRGKYAAPIWGHQPGPLTNLLRALAFIILVALVLFPFLVVVSTSLSTRQAITDAGGLVVIPTEISLEAYTRILTGGVVTQSVLVSVFVTVVGTAISLVVTTLPPTHCHGPARCGTAAC